MALSHIHALESNTNEDSRNVFKKIITGFGVHGSQMSHFGPVKPGLQVHINPDPICVH
jgi:hypothetical protein